MSLMLCGLIAAMVAHPAGADEPGDLYFDGFQAFKAGESLESAGKKTEAIKKYQIAEEKIAAVQKQYPEWQRDVVEYRLRIIRKKLADLGTPSQSSSPAPTPEAAPILSLEPMPCSSKER